MNWPVEAVEWRSGIGGAQCDDCGRTTIVQQFGVIEDADGQHTELLCLPCYMGDDLDLDDEGGEQ